MGVPGLTTYITQNSDNYLQPYKLHNTYLVVDGNNIASHLYLWVSKTDSAFGGDYDEYYTVVKKFFLLLKKCIVTPIVLFDGGQEKRKIKTTLSRLVAKLNTLRAYAQGFSTSKFCPLFMKQTFFDVMEDLRIFCVQCELEADSEIAAVAKALNCPVLSYDSDFYLYDVLYIPFSSVCLEAVQLDSTDRFYVKCSIYNVTNFIEQFPGFGKSVLPVIATLLGNDYINNSVFEKFFNHVIMVKQKNRSYNQRRIHGLLCWLKKENLESATKLILTHLDKKGSRKFLQAVQISKCDYGTRSFLSEPVLNKLSSEITDINLIKKKIIINLPSEIVELYSHCKIHKFIIDMITLGIYFTPLQVEQVYNQSCHFPSLQLISEMYTILTPYKKGIPELLKLYLIVKNHYCAIKIEDFSCNELTRINLTNILKAPKKVRLMLLCKIACIDEIDLKIICNNSWSVFIISLIYWIRKLNETISFAHIHALILMAIANQVVQKYVGYFKNFNKFTKSKGKLLNQLKSTPVITREYKDFEEMLAGVTLYEKLLVQSILIPYRQTTEKGTGKKYSISTIHLFGCFQSCLYHIEQWNALLNFPLPHMKISDFYSGTLLYNFYLIIKSKPPVEKFGCNLFKDTPNLRKIYIHLYEGLCKYLEKVPQNVKKKQKRKNTEKQGPNRQEEMSEEEIVFYEDDDDEYDDENNPYAILRSAEIAK